VLLQGIWGLHTQPSRGCKNEWMSCDSTTSKPANTVAGHLSSVTFLPKTSIYQQQKQ
jgi:hypothetical protein